MSARSEGGRLIKVKPQRDSSSLTMSDVLPASGDQGESESSDALPNSSRQETDNYIEPNENPSITPSNIDFVPIISGFDDEMERGPFQSGLSQRIQSAGSGRSAIGRDCMTPVEEITMLERDSLKDIRYTVSPYSETRVSPSSTDKDGNQHKKLSSSDDKLDAPTENTLNHDDLMMDDHERKEETNGSAEEKYSRKEDEKQTNESPDKGFIEVKDQANTSISTSLENSCTKEDLEESTFKKENLEEEGDTDYKLSKDRESDQSRTNLIRDLSSRLSSSKSIYSRGRSAQGHEHTKQLNKNFDSFQKFDKNIFVDSSYTRLQTPADLKFDKLALSSYSKQVTPCSTPGETTPGRLLSTQSSPYQSQVVLSRKSDESKAKVGSNLSLGDPVEKQKSRSRNEVGLIKVATNRTQLLREHKAKTPSKVEYALKQGKRISESAKESQGQFTGSQNTPAKQNKVKNPPVKSKSNLSSKSYQLKREPKAATTTDNTSTNPINNNTGASNSTSQSNISNKPIREVDQLFKKFNAKENFSSRLLEMAHNGEWTNLDEVLRSFERHNEELNIADEETGITLLMLAAKDNRIKTADKLLELNADINVQAKDGRSALHFASMYGKDDGLRLLLNRKADANIIGGVNDQLALHMACYRTFHGASLMVQNLLRTTRDGRLTPDKNGHIPLHIAVSSRNTSSCKELLSQQTNEQLNCPLANLETVLHLACKMKDTDMVSVLLEHKADVNAQNINGQTPLHVSVQENNIQLVKVLHQHGASIELTDKDDKTPLHVATEQGFAQIVDYLAEKQRADITGRTRNGDTLVHLAASSGQPDVALVFLKRGLLIHMPNKFGATCLHAAAKSGHSGVIQTLISKGAKVDARTKDDHTPLHVAAEFCNSAAIQTMIGHGASVDARGGKNKETPLHIASGNIGGEECVEILLKSGAEVNSVQENLETPLHIAACNENLNVMELLIREGADMTLLSKNGENPLHLSVRSCHIDSVSFLLDKYSEKYPDGNLSDYVNQANQEGETSLHYACELAKCQSHYDDEDVDIVKLLLLSGGDVNLKTRTTSETPIHYCAKSGNHDIARAMFEYLGPAKTTSAINKLSNNGSSGLLVACQEGHLDTVKAFLSHHARVDVFEEQGKAPLHLAAENGHYDVAEELVRHRAYAGAKTKMGLTPLHYAAQNGHARLAILIADKHKSSMEAVTLERQTPLHLAAQNGQKAVVSCLLRMKANAEARNNKGQTALHLAAENDHSDVVKMLLKSKPDLVVSANSDGMTCAHIAASKGRLAVVEELMRFNKEAVLTAKNKTNESTPLQLAVIGGHVDVVQSLMKAGASATEENSDGMSALMLAARHGHLKILDILKDLLPLDTVSQKTGYTALHVASKYGQQEFVRELLNNVSHDLLTSEPQLDFMKVLLDLNSDYGFTALHLAAEFGHESLVRFLLNSTKIMSDAKSSLQGVTALHQAASNGHADVASLLLSKLSVLISVKDRKGRLPLHLAAYNGRLNMVTLLLGQGTDVDADDQNGCTALHYASKAGHLDVVQLLVSSGCNTKLITKDGKPAASLAASASHKHVLSYLMKQDLDTRHFLEDNKFAFDLMELGKLNDQEPLAEFILASRVPAETSAKLSKIFRQLALKEKERANDLEEAAKYCDQLALELTAIACNIVHAGVLLNALEDKEVTFLDLLIDCEQKEVIAYPTIQMYLSEVWTGYLSQWSSWKMLVLLLCMLLCPPFWIIISLPLDIRISKIPVVKFMSHMVSHMYLIVLFILCTVYPTYNLWEAPDNTPAWSEWLLLAWLSGLVVEQLTNNENPSGLGWLRLFLLVISTIAVLFNIAAYSFGDESSRSVLMYIRNQWFALAMLLAFVLLMEFLSFHHLFGPWAIIIGELLKDLLRFIVVLAIFMLGFTFQISAAYMPVFRSTNDTSSDPDACSPTATSTDEVTTLQSPKLNFEMLFFALFGLIDMGSLPCLSNQPWWSIYLLKSIIAIYMLITFIMLVNLLIAMMSDTYAEIQAQSDVEWKFGRAKLFQNMNKTSSAPAPIILITKLITYITILHRYKSAGCVYNTQPFVNEIEGLDSDLTIQSAEKFVSSPDVEDSTGGKCCPCFKKKNSDEASKRTATKPPQDKLEEVISWKIVSEKYLSLTKKNQAEEIED